MQRTNEIHSLSVLVSVTWLGSVGLTEKLCFVCGKCDLPCDGSCDGSPKERNRCKTLALNEKVFDDFSTIDYFDWPIAWSHQFLVSDDTELVVEGCGPILDG